MSRADRVTPKQQQVLYSDFLINFDQNPVTGFLAKAVNEDAVKNSIRTLIMTDLNERPFQPNIGSKIRSLLFEPLDDVTASLIKTTIYDTVRSGEPRAKLDAVIATPNFEFNAYFITIVFSMINIPEPITLNLILRRVR